GRDSDVSFKTSSHSANSVKNWFDASPERRTISSTTRQFASLTAPTRRPDRPTGNGPCEPFGFEFAPLRRTKIHVNLCCYSEWYQELIFGTDWSAYPDPDAKRFEQLTN